MGVFIIQLATAAVGSFGFALIFNVSRKLLWTAPLGGLISWGVYLLCYEVFGIDLLMSNVIASACCQIYAEILARLLRTPTTVICIPSLIPMIPGGSLYNTMYSAVHTDWTMFRYYGSQTLQTTLGIAIGLSFVSAILYILTNHAKQRALH